MRISTVFCLYLCNQWTKFCEAGTVQISGTSRTINISTIFFTKNVSLRYVFPHINSLGPFIGTIYIVFNQWCGHIVLVEGINLEIHPKPVKMSIRMCYSDVLNNVPLNYKTFRRWEIRRTYLLGGFWDRETESGLQTLIGVTDLSILGGIFVISRRGNVYWGVRDASECTGNKMHAVSAPHGC